MKKHLMVLGDVRFGDCFHVGAYLNSLKNEYETTWIHGPYERQAVKFMRDYCNLNIVCTVEKPSVCYKYTQIPIPMDLVSINNFIKEQNEDESGYDLVTKETGPLYFKPGDPVLFETKDLPIVQAEKEYIVIHASSVSSWKNHNILNTLPLGITAYSVGVRNEEAPPYALDFKSKPLEEVASLMKGAKCVVGIHSSMACFAFHLGVPLIALHFWNGGGGQIRFSDYRPYCMDILTPTTENIMDNIRLFGGW